MAAPPELNPAVVVEVLVRLPRDNPADLLRASAVCKSWLRTVADPTFRRRYRDLHPTSAVLGFLRNPADRGLARFVSTTAFRPAAATDDRAFHVLDCHHGRALFYDHGSSRSAYVVWDPVTGREHRIPDDDVMDRCMNHAVLCARAAAGCDHSACNVGPFLVASVGVDCAEDDTEQADASVYSSEIGGARRGPPDSIYLHGEEHNLVADRPGALVGGTLYFICESGALLRYDVLGTRRDLSVIEPPPGKSLSGSRTIVTTPENGGLGLAALRRDVLRLWSAETGPGGDVKWVKMNSIKLQNLMPLNFKSPARFIRFSEDMGNVVLVSSDDHCIFSIDLESLVTKKVFEMDKADDFFPYVCFYTPAASARGMLQATVDPRLSSTSHLMI